MNTCICPHCGGKFIATVVNASTYDVSPTRNLIREVIDEYENFKIHRSLLDATISNESEMEEED